MLPETAKASVDAAEEMGIEASLRETYSGRGMYGKSTVAVVIGGQSNLLQAVALAAVRLCQELDDNPDDFLEDLAFRYDNMGHDIVVY